MMLLQYILLIMSLLSLGIPQDQPIQDQVYIGKNLEMPISYRCVDVCKCISRAESVELLVTAFALY